MVEVSKSSSRSDTLKKRTWDAPSDSYYLQGRGYTEKDIEEVVSEAAGTNMHDWFERYVDGVEQLPFERTLEVLDGAEELGLRRLVDRQI